MSFPAQIRTNVFPGLSTQTVINCLLRQHSMHAYFYPVLMPQPARLHTANLEDQIEHRNDQWWDQVLPLCEWYIFVCMWWIPGEQHLPECIHLQHTVSTPLFIVWCAIILVFVKEILSSTIYALKILQSLLLPFMQQEVNVLFQKHNSRSHNIHTL